MRAAAAVILPTIITILLIALPFYLLGRGTFLATFQNVLARGSWMSPWAILDGYYGTGTVASLSDRLYYNASALWGQPARYPWLWWLAVALAGVVYVRRWRAAARTGTPRAAVALTAFGLALLLLLNRGFSTQFTVWLLPFVALLLPGLDGAILVVLLTLVNLVLEAYLYVTLFPTLHRLLWVSAGARTVLLLWFAIESGAAVDPKSALRWTILRRSLTWPSAGAAAALTVVAALVVGPGLGAAVASQNGSAALGPALAAISPDAAVVFTQPTVYDRVERQFQPRPALLLAEPNLLKWTGDRSLDHRLTTDLAGRTDVVLVSDTAQPAVATTSAIQSWLGARYGAEPERKVGSLSLVVFRQSLRPAEQPVGARFGSAIDLVGYAPASLAAAPGAPLAVTLHWRAAAKPDRDFTVSLQLLDPSGKLAAQRDAMPVSNTEPTSGWRPGQDVFDPTSLTVPPQSPPGLYHVIVVVYDNQTSRRLPVAGSGAAGDHALLGDVSVR